MKLPLWLIAALLSIGCVAVGQILLKIGVRTSPSSDLLRHPLQLLAVFLNPYVAGGIAFFAVSMILWLVAIRGQQLSTVYPLAALGYVIVTVLSVKIFHDSMTLGKLAGIALIVTGVVVLSSSGAGVPQSERPAVHNTRAP